MVMFRGRCCCACARCTVLMTRMSSSEKNTNGTDGDEKTTLRRNRCIFSFSAARRGGYRTVLAQADHRGLETRAHPSQRLGEIADLVARLDADRHIQIAETDSIGDMRQAQDRSNNAARE